MENMVVNYPANFLNLERHIDVFAPNDIVNEELINNDHVDRQFNRRINRNSEIYNGRFGSA